MNWGIGWGGKPPHPLVYGRGHHRVREWRSRQTIIPNRLTLCPAGKRADKRKTCNEALYAAGRINLQGWKKTFVFYNSDTEGEKFWGKPLNELLRCGAYGILMVCTDRLTGFPDMIRTGYSNTRIQLCIVLMFRNSTKFVSYRHHKVISVDLEAIYTATSKKADRKALVKSM